MKTWIGFHLLQFFLWMATFFNLSSLLIPLINKTYHYLLFTTTTTSTIANNNNNNNNNTTTIDISHRIFNFDCLYQQYVCEWSIPVESTQLALSQLSQLIDNAPFYVHFPIEVRFVAKDEDILLSPSYGRDSCYINVIAFKSYSRTPPRFREYFEGFAKMMHSLDGRPHWAKELLSSLTVGDYERMYPQWREFGRLRREVDPKGLFANAYIQRLFYDMDG